VSAETAIGDKALRVCVEPTAHVKVAGVTKAVPSISKNPDPSMLEVIVIDACAEGEVEVEGVGEELGEGEPEPLKTPDKPAYAPIETKIITAIAIVM
jgi:hypothetical protein